MNETRKDVADFVDPDELVELASELTRFESYSDHELEVAQWVGDYMKSQGFDVELHEVEPGRPNVIARIEGRSPGTNVMFNGHLDVDPLPDTYKHDPWKIELRDGKLWGHGLGNMKAGVASMMHAANAIKRAGGPERGSITVACVVGELQSGVGTAHLVREGIDSHVAFVPEPSDMNIRTMHTAIFTVLIRVTGIPGWLGGTHRYKTVNAIDKMADVIAALRSQRINQVQRDEFPNLPKTLVSAITGGLGSKPTMSRSGYVPDRCTIMYEARVTPGTDFASVQADIESTLQLLRDADPDLVVELLPPPAPYEAPFRSGPVAHPGLYLKPDDDLAVLTASVYSEIRGVGPDRIGPEDPGSNGCTDAGHLFEAGVRALVFGPTKNLFGESYVDVGNMVDHSRILATIAERIASEPANRWSIRGED